MKYFIRFIKLIVPILALSGMNSGCKKEECCTWTDNFGDTYSYCEEDNRWGQYYSSWNQVKSIAEHYGGKCSK